jgi:hypothetical protein
MNNLKELEALGLTMPTPLCIIGAVQFGIFGYATYRRGRKIDWLTFYQHSRLHSTLGYVSPMKFEERWSAAQ